MCAWKLIVVLTIALAVPSAACLVLVTVFTIAAASLTPSAASRKPDAAPLVVLPLAPVDKGSTACVSSFSRAG
eukprot:11187366-Lingulodinium_polyedra.AAC.1